MTKFQKTITQENTLYNIELEIKNKILYFHLINSKDTVNTYKNNYTYLKLVNKIEQLSFIADNIETVMEEIINLIKISEFEFQVFDFFVLFSLKFSKFSNKLKNFNLQLNLYKTDSRQATLMVNQLEIKVNKMMMR